MNKGPYAIRACYSEWRLIKTRSAVQLIFEVPLHDADAAYQVLGGMPQPGSEQWFAIAAITHHERAHPNRGDSGNVELDCDGEDSRQAAPAGNRP